MFYPPLDPVKAQLLAAILPHIAFEGWSQSAFDAAVAETGIGPAQARVICPRGAVDLAIAFHREGDRVMLVAVKAADLQNSALPRKSSLCSARAYSSDKRQRGRTSRHGLVCVAAYVC